MGNVSYGPSYRSNRRVLTHMMTRFWLRKKTRKALEANYLEIVDLRHRVTLMAQEINEWRWKVGGAAYQMNGMEAKNLVLQGLRDKGFYPTNIIDEDFKNINFEPPGK